MPRGDRFLNSLFSPNASKTVVRGRVLSPLEILSLTSALQADAGDLYYSAWVTFLDAIKSIESQSFTWATVKLYYSVFYSLRAVLSKDGFCAFYVDDSYYIVRAVPSARPVSSKFRGDHKSVLNTFSEERVNDPLLSQEIDFLPPLQWFMKQREQSNYKRERFLEPDENVIFRGIEKSTLQQAINAYSADSSMTYTFDKDHAVLAFPFALLRTVGKELNADRLIRSSDEEKRFLKQRSRIRGNTVAPLIREMHLVGLIT